MRMRPVISCFFAVQVRRHCLRVSRGALNCERLNAFRTRSVGTHRMLSVFSVGVDVELASDFGRPSAHNRTPQKLASGDVAENDCVKAFDRIDDQCRHPKFAVHAGDDQIEAGEQITICAGALREIYRPSSFTRVVRRPRQSSSAYGTRTNKVIAASIPRL